MKIPYTFLALLLLLAASPFPIAEDTPATALDALTQAGSENNTPAFLALLSTDAVFLGLDGSSRLQGESLRHFLSERFDRLEGWGFLSSDRKVRLSETGSIAWFEENLEHDSLGQGWGSGVMTRTNEGWKIAQYNLAVPAPNGNTTPVAQVDRGVSPPAGNLATDISGDSAAMEAVAPPPEKKKTCQRMRHKTNRASSC